MGEGEGQALSVSLPLLAVDIGAIDLAYIFLPPPQPHQPPSQYMYYFTILLLLLFYCIVLLVCYVKYNHVVLFPVYLSNPSIKSTCRPCLMLK